MLNEQKKVQKSATVFGMTLIQTSFLCIVIFKVKIQKYLMYI